MGKIVRLATKEDIASVLSFWEKADIYVEKIERYIDSFVLIEGAERELLATVGFEPIEGDGLLRSLVITPSLTERDLFILFQTIISVAEEKGIRHLYLMTNKRASIPFFELLSFQEIDVNQLPESIKQSKYTAGYECGLTQYVMKYIF